MDKKEKIVPINSDNIHFHKISNKINNSKIMKKPFKENKLKFLIISLALFCVKVLILISSYFF